MTRVILLGVYAFALFTITSAAPGSRRKPPSNITVDCSSNDDLDEFARQVGVYGDRAHRIPGSRTQHDKEFCPMIKKAERHIRAYARQCLKPFPKQIVGLSMYGSSRNTKRICDNEEGAEEYLKYNLCSAKATDEQMEASHVCMDNYIRATESTRDTVTDLNLKLPYTCCNFHTFKNCISRTAAAYCLADAVAYTRRAMEETSFEVMDLICKGWEDGSEGCANIAKLKLAPKPMDKSIFPASIDIFTSL